jgi:hypothetical protein
MRIFITTLIIGLVSISFAQEQYAKARIWANSQELHELAELGIPVDHGSFKKNTFITSDFSETQIELARSAGFQVDILIDNVKEYYSSAAFQNQAAVKNVNCPTNGGGTFNPSVPANFGLGSMAGFYTYQEYLDILDDMVSQYPSLISVKSPVSDTLTHEGRPVYYVKISNDPTVDQGKPRVLYSAIHHAREPGSLSQTIFYMWYLLENYGTDPEVTYLVDNMELFFVPVINPDGYIHNVVNDPNGGGMHRKNKNPNVGNTNPGVDLNRNYSYQWGTTGVNLTNQNSDVYPGSGPFSEPETKNMKKIAENWNVTLASNAHTHGALMLYPIGATSGEFAVDHTYFDAISNHMVKFNGYEAMKSSGLYPASGDSDDYMYKTEGILAITPEVSFDGFWAPQAQITPDCIDMLFPNLTFAHLALVYGVTTNLDELPRIETVSGDFNFQIQRLGQQAGSLTVSVEPIAGIQSTGNPIVYPNLQLEEQQVGAISYQLENGIQYGDEIKYVLATDNGLWINRDTIVKTFGSPALQFSDPVNDLSNWSGSWDITNATFYSADYSITDSPNANYQNNTNEELVLLNTIDLTNAIDAEIRFKAKWEIENDWDYVQFQVSTDGGNSWEAQCGTYTNPGTANNGGLQPVGAPLFDGVQSDWVQEVISLTDYLGEDIQVRFIIVTDGFVQEDGFYFDDFEVFYNLSPDAGLSPLQKFAFNVFPNPASESVKVAFSNVMEGGTIKIVNNLGQCVKAISIDQPTTTIETDISNLEKGVYYVSFDHLGGLANPKRLIVLK